MRNTRFSNAMDLARATAVKLARLTERSDGSTRTSCAPDTTASPFFTEDAILPRMVYPGARVAERYWIEEEIGIGGLCFVHRVRDEQSGQAFALKTLQPGFSDMPFYFDLMRREAEIQSMVSHANILSCERLITAEDGRQALLLPYLSGGTLSQRIRENGPLPVDECCKLLGEMLDVLACLRHSGIAHLDIAPDNIMYADVGFTRIQLIDFGLSRNNGGATLPDEENLFLGKMSWASPEMVHGGTVTPDSDLYSLGLVLHFALTGEHFVRDESFLEMDPPVPAETTASERLRSSLTSLLDLAPPRRRRVYLEQDGGQHPGMAAAASF